MGSRREQLPYVIGTDMAIQQAVSLGTGQRAVMVCSWVPAAVGLAVRWPCVLDLDPVVLASLN